MKGPLDPHPTPGGRGGNRDEPTDSGKAAQLRRLRLLVALDALLVAGSVKGAAEQVGLSVPAMSRLLGQIRNEVGDPIFIRSGKRLTPTPRAEEMRLGLRRLVSEVEGLLDRRVAPLSSVEAVVLFGIALVFAFNALVALIQYIADVNTLQQVVFWSMGSLARANWSKIAIVAAVLALCLPFSMRHVCTLTEPRCSVARVRGLVIAMVSVNASVLIAKFL